MSANPLLGEIMTVGFNFAPRGWSLCEGQLLSINSNQALFSLLGTTYGGDGRTTFGLPDLRGRSAVEPGNGPGLDTIRQGQRGGAYSLTISTSHMPSHKHTAVINADKTVGTSRNPSNNFLAVDSGADKIYIDTVASAATMNAGAITVGFTGGGIPLNTRNPFLGMYNCIALAGVFPSRS